MRYRYLACSERFSGQLTLLNLLHLYSPIGCRRFPTKVVTTNHLGTLIEGWIADFGGAEGAVPVGNHGINGSVQGDDRAAK